MADRQAPSWVAHSEAERGVSPIDSRTPLNFAAGLVASALGIPDGLFVMLVIAVEATEAVARHGPHGWYRANQPPPESLANRLGDVIARLAGYYVAKRLRAATPARPLGHVPAVLNHQADLLRQLR